MSCYRIMLAKQIKKNQTKKKTNPQKTPLQKKTHSTKKPTKPNPNKTKIPKKVKPKQDRLKIQTTTKKRKKKKNPYSEFAFQNKGGKNLSHLSHFGWWKQGALSYWRTNTCRAGISQTFQHGSFLRVPIVLLLLQNKELNTPLQEGLRYWVGN